MSYRQRLLAVLAALLFCVTLAPQGTRADDNKIMGEVNFVPSTKVEKSAGVWIDGQYVGHVSELKGDKKILLLPGQHDVNVRQSGHTDFDQKVTVEPGKTLEVMVQLARDPRVQYSKVTSEIKLHVEPDRAAVFLDGSFVGYVHEFGGVGRAMLVSPGKHEIKIALPGYRDFTSEVNLLPKQKFTIETKLLTGSISQADPAVKKDD